MGMARLFSVVLMLAAAPAFAASVVSYELQLGGDNHAADVIALQRPMYTPGSPADGLTFSKGVLNWAASIAVTGLHSQTGHASDGKPTWGVANFVVSIELHEGTADGPLVTTADFYSSIHDGGAVPCTTCKGGGGFCAGSAFALSYKRVPTWTGYARVTEAASSGVYYGPFMEVCMWPTVPAAAGKILGTGAGYAQWCRGCGLGTTTTPGIGIPAGTPVPVGSGTFGLDIVPVIEGQIDTSTLALGTYVLRLVPGTGTNVLRGDVDLMTAPTSGPQVQAFAVAANEAVEDTITFTLSEADPCAEDTVAPAIVSTLSRKTHGTKGDFDVDLTAGNVVEGRTGGLTKLIVTFSEPIQAAGGTAGPESVSVTSGTVGNVAINGDALTVDLAGVTNADRFIIAFPGIQDACGNAVTETKCVRVLFGDINGDGKVNTMDMTLLRNNVGMEITTTNCRADLNISGTFNTQDMTLVRNNVGTIMANPCP